MSFPDYCLRYRRWVTDEPTRVRAAHPISLTFAPANYAAPQTATFNGVPDFEAINDRATILPSSHGVVQLSIFIKLADLDFSRSANRKGAPIFDLYHRLLFIFPAAPKCGIDSARGEDRNGSRATHRACDQLDLFAFHPDTRELVYGRWG